MNETALLAATPPTPAAFQVDIVDSEGSAVSGTLTVEMTEQGVKLILVAGSLNSERVVLWDNFFAEAPNGQAV